MSWHGLIGNSCQMDWITSQQIWSEYSKMLKVFEVICRKYFQRISWFRNFSDWFKMNRVKPLWTPNSTHCPSKTSSSKWLLLLKGVMWCNKVFSFFLVALNVSLKTRLPTHLASMLAILHVWSWRPRTECCRRTARNAMAHPELWRWSRTLYIPAFSNQLFPGISEWNFF